MTKLRLSGLLPAILFCFCIVPEAEAQIQYGVRAGVSADPTQFVFGGHLETRPLLKNFTFRPNLEIGLGSDQTVVAVNFEFVYSIPIESKPLRVYFGGGPALVVTDHWDGDADVGGGFNLLIGLQHSKGLFGEIKVGMIDSPDFKFTIGYAFK